MVSSLRTSYIVIIINTYCCMKSGIKNYDCSGNAGPIPSERAQQLVDDYNAALQEKYPDNWQEQPFDGQIAYDIGGGLSHGHLAIGDGAVKKGPIIDSAKANEIRPSTSRSYQNLFRMYEEEVQNKHRLSQQNAVLTRHVKRTDHLQMIIDEKANIVIPPDMLVEEENDMRETGDGSSHASANLDINSDGH
ncbi:hypothetical protein PVAP13_1NG233100 [Panicum virgatum]|uniref:Uncharacterized protein n=1 Tax=Panicum virgatum TaxID=38727 RepID=A0A8T0WNM4_PANVG|nr:hypothetical protein PVAP13_1NG233100 [Panicum virgatum]